MLALGEGDGEFGIAPGVDEEEHGHDGEAAFLGAGLEFLQLAAVEEQFAVALGTVAPEGTELVLGDVHVPHEEFVADEGAPGVGEVGLAFAYALDFAAHEGEARGVLVEEEVLEGGAFVLDFYEVFLFHVEE